MKYAVAIVTLTTAAHAQFPEDPVLEGLSVKYLDVTWAEYLELVPNEDEIESYKFETLPQPEVDYLRARPEPEVGFWFDPDYVAPAVDPGAEYPD